MKYWIKQYFTRPETHLWAAIEVLITFALGLMPFIVAYLKTSTANEGGELTEFWTLLNRGQLYLLTYGLFGPILWLAFIKPDVARHNARAILGLIALFAIFPVVGFLGIDPSFSTIQNERIVSYSYLFYAAFLFLNYLLVFYCTIEPPTAEETLNKGSRSMKDMYDREYGK